MLGQLLHSALRPLGTQGGAAAARKAAMQQQQQEGAAGQAQGQGGAFGILTQPLGWLLKIDELAEAVSSQVGGRWRAWSRLTHEWAEGVP